MARGTQENLLSDKSVESCQPDHHQIAARRNRSAVVGHRLWRLRRDLAGTTGQQADEKDDQGKHKKEQTENHPDEMGLSDIEQTIAPRGQLPRFPVFSIVLFSPGHIVAYNGRCFSRLGGYPDGYVVRAPLHDKQDPIVLPADLRHQVVIAREAPSADEDCIVPTDDYDAGLGALITGSEEIDGRNGESPYLPWTR